MDNDKNKHKNTKNKKDESSNIEDWMSGWGEQNAGVDLFRGKTIVRSSPESRHPDGGSKVGVGGRTVCLLQLL